MEVLYLSSKAKEQAIKEIIDSSSCFVNLDREKLYQAVLERESLGSTNLGHGVLATHGQLDGVVFPKVSVGVIKEGIVLPSNEVIYFILVFASDPLRYDLYVKKLSTVLNLFHDPLVLSSLLDAEVVKELQMV